MATRKNRKYRKAKAPKRAIRVVPTKRKQIDTDSIAMSYWMIAKRIVEERRKT